MYPFRDIHGIIAANKVGLWEWGALGNMMKHRVSPYVANGGAARIRDIMRSSGNGKTELWEARMLAGSGARKVGLAGHLWYN